MTVIIDTAGSPFTAARAQLAAALTAATGYDCHPDLTGNFITPCYVLAGAGWTHRNGVALYRVTVTCVLGGSDTGQLHGGVEELARLAHVVCVDESFAVAEVPVPGLLELPDGGQAAAVAFTAEIPALLRGS